MKIQKLLRLLNEASDSKFVARKWNILKGRLRNEIISNTEVLKYNLCNYNNVYILVRGDITIVGDNETQVAFNNCAPFTNCTQKFDGTIKNDAKDLDLFMQMYNLLEYSLNYSDTAGSLWFYSKDEADSFNANISNTDTFKSFK